MKKLMTLLLAAFIGIPCLAQQMRMGLVKDEDGYTNIRKGPGTKYEIVDQIPDGMFVYFMSANKIVVPPRQGPWKEVAQVKDEDGYTNIRKGPGTKYAIVGKVLDGGFILISGDINDRWYKIYTQKGVLRGYISANKVMRLESPAF